MSRGKLIGVVVVAGIVAAGAAFLLLQRQEPVPQPVIAPSATPEAYQTVDDLYRAENQLNQVDVDADTTNQFTTVEQELTTR